MDIELFHPRALELLGFIPQFLSQSDKRPAAVQFDEFYAHGGGWQPTQGWKTSLVTHQTGEKVLLIEYPGDPPYMPVAMIRLHDERIWVYADAWVAIEQPDGSVEIARMD